MLSLTCKTAIKAVVYLAARPAPEEKAGMKEIAAYINASEHTVGKILQTLVKEGVINSTKGPNGGFYLAAKQLKQPVMKVIDAIDGKEVFEQCGLGLSKCSSTHPCPIHHDFKLINDRFKSLCRHKTISDLCETVAGGLTYLVG